jgi:hypothetical protein
VWTSAFDTNVIITSIAGAVISASIDILVIGFSKNTFEIPAPHLKHHVAAIGKDSSVSMT